MRKTNNRTRDITAALYLRISRDDNLDGESYSISNQKRFLTKSAKERGYSKLIYFIDDGISGTTMERPDFKRMISEIEKGYIGAVFVKDMSRLGRNYLKVGYYTEEFFPNNDVRLVAVSDGVDSSEGDNEFTPFRNIMNEWYARDISKKVRVANRTKGLSGEPLSKPPYGYKDDPDNKKRWLIDEEPARVVKKIFDLTLAGYGTSQIADILDNEKILTPHHYNLKVGKKIPSKGTAPSPTYWRSQTIDVILSKQEYCGDIINFKSFTKSYKNKKRIKNDLEDMAIFKDVNKAIIDRDIFEQIQEKRAKSIRKKTTKTGEKNMFSGLLRCSDCGANMHFHFQQQNPNIQYFSCPNNNKSRKTCYKSHRIQVAFLGEVILKEIRRLTKFASYYEDDFVKIVAGHSRKTNENMREFKQKQLKGLKMRDKELDALFGRMYEDNISGKIDDDRFARLSRKYTDEQTEIAEQVKKLQKEIDNSKDKAFSTDSFIKTVRKYTRARKLTERMLNELIDHIEVFHAEKIDGVKTQKLIIHYNFIGNIDIPNLHKIPETKVKMQMRQGVVLNFERGEQAM